MSSNGARPHTWKIQDIERFRQLWYDPAMSLAKIAEHFDVNAWTVSMTARRLGYPPRFDLRRLNKPPNGNGYDFRRCELCSYLEHCTNNPHADLFPCEDTRYPTPYVDGAERIEIYRSVGCDIVVRLADGR